MPQTYRLKHAKLCQFYEGKLSKMYLQCCIISRGSTKLSVSCISRVWGHHSSLVPPLSYSLHHTLNFFSDIWCYTYIFSWSFWSPYLSYKCNPVGAGEIVQWLSLLAIFQEDMDIISHIGQFMITCNYSFREFYTFFWPPGAPTHTWKAYTYIA